MIKRYLGVTLLTAGVVLAGCSSSDDDDPGTTDPIPATCEACGADGVTENLLQTATAATNFTSLLQAAADAGIALDGDGFVTVFAPTDEAFAALPDGTVATADILNFHIVPNSALSAADLTDGLELTMANGDTATIGRDADDNVTIAGVAVTAADTYTTNGVIHTLGAVLTPPVDEPDTMEPGTMEPDTMTPPDGDEIVSELTRRGNFTMLLALIAGGSLTDTLQGDNGGDGWTLFAPDDTALAGVDVAGMDAATQNITARNHLLAGQVASTAVVAGPLTMNSNNVAEVTVDGTTITIGGATVTEADISVGNGTIHLISAPITAAAPAAGQ